MTTTFIVNNGRGGFVEALQAMRLGYDFNGYELFEQGRYYRPFEVKECRPDELRGEQVEGVTHFRTETGGLYKALQ